MNSKLSDGKSTFRDGFRAVRNGVVQDARQAYQSGWTGPKGRGWTKTDLMHNAMHSGTQLNRTKTDALGLTDSYSPNVSVGKLVRNSMQTNYKGAGSYMNPGAYTGTTKLMPKLKR